MTQREFEKQIIELVPQSNRDTTEALYRLGLECEDLDPSDILITLGFINRNFDRLVLQETYEVINYGSALLPNEMIAAAVYLQNGDTPRHITQLAYNGHLGCSFAPRTPEEPSPLAICTVVENGETKKFYSEFFGSYMPEAALHFAHGFALTKNISVTQALERITISMEMDEGVAYGRRILKSNDAEMIRALFSVFRFCPAVAAHITYDVDHGQVIIQRNQSWQELQLCHAFEAPQRGGCDDEQLKLSEMKPHQLYIINDNEGYSEKLVLFRRNDMLFYGNSWCEDGTIYYSISSKLPNQKNQYQARALAYINPQQTLWEICDEFHILYIEWADLKIATPAGYFVFETTLMPVQLNKLDSEKKLPMLERGTATHARPLKIDVEGGSIEIL